MCDDCNSSGFWIGGEKVPEIDYHRFRITQLICQMERIADEISQRQKRIILLKNEKDVDINPEM